MAGLQSGGVGRGMEARSRRIQVELSDLGAQRVVGDKMEGRLLLTILCQKCRLLLWVGAKPPPYMAVHVAVWAIPLRRVQHVPRVFDDGTGSHLRASPYSLPSFGSVYYLMRMYRFT